MMQNSHSLLEKIYLGLLGTLIGLIVATPLLINRGVSIFGEEVLEVVVSASLIIVGFLIYSLYNREIKKHQKTLEETFNYIGNINLQISNIKSVFNEMRKYPENKNDFKDILKFLAKKALGIVNVEWVLFRIIETESTKTLAEHFQARGKVSIVRHEVSNKNLVVNKYCEGCTVIESNQDNFNIQAYCVVPQQISQEEEILIRAIVNNLAMLYLILASGFYKNGKNNNNPIDKE